jgi:hypothetical protein
LIRGCKDLWLLNYWKSHLKCCSNNNAGNLLAKDNFIIEFDNDYQSLINVIKIREARILNYTCKRVYNQKQLSVNPIEYFFLTSKIFHIVVFGNKFAVVIASHNFKSQSSDSNQQQILSKINLVIMFWFTRSQINTNTQFTFFFLLYND